MSQKTFNDADVRSLIAAVTGNPDARINHAILDAAEQRELVLNAIHVHKMTSQLVDGKFVLVADDQNGWLPIASAPRDGTAIQLAFKGQFHWVMWVGRMGPNGLIPDGHAEPEFWQPMPAEPVRGEG